MGTNLWNSRQEDRTYVRRRSIAIIAGLGVATAGLVAVDMRAYHGAEQDELALAESLPSIDFSQGGVGNTSSTPKTSELVTTDESGKLVRGESDPTGPARSTHAQVQVDESATQGGVTRTRESRLRVTETTSAVRPVTAGETLAPGLKRPKIVPAPFIPPSETDTPQPVSPSPEESASPPETSPPIPGPETGTPEDDTPVDTQPGDDVPTDPGSDEGDISPLPSPADPEVGEPVTPTPDQPEPTKEPAPPTPTPTQTLAPKPKFMFGSCKQAWLNGVGMLQRGGPGWNPALDTDGNGTACERPPAGLLNP